MLVTGLLTACSTPRTAKAANALAGSPEAKVAGGWSPKAAAAYLDQRADWWMGWQGAARDHGTFCVFFAPPLVMTEADIDRLVSVARDAVEVVLGALR